MTRRIEEACPFDARTRAARCEGCCRENQVPPCVQAWLAAAKVRDEEQPARWRERQAA